MISSIRFVAAGSNLPLAAIVEAAALVAELGAIE